MKKYLTKLIFQVSFENDKEASHFDEQMRVIHSPTVEDAFYKARQIGRKEEETFYDQFQKPVSWKFIDVAELYPLEEFHDGDQVFSASHVTSDSNSYIRYIRSKSMEIQAKSLTFA